MTKKKKKVGGLHKKAQKTQKALESSGEKHKPKYTHLFQGLILFAVGMLLYWPTTDFDFVLDDKIVYSENEFVQKGFSGISDLLTKESFTGYFGEQQKFVVGARYRPLSLVTFAIEYQMWGLNASYSHMVNNLLYALLSILIFYCLLLLFPKAKGKWFSPVFLSALLFVLHPIHTEVVANIKGRDELLALLFGVAAMILFMHYIKKRQVLWLFGSLLCFFLGILSKENVLPFVLLIPLLSYFFNKRSLSVVLRQSIPFLLVTMAYLWMRYGIIGYLLSDGTKITALMNNPFLEMDLAERFATISYTLVIYLKLLFFPYPLTHDYYPYHIPIMNWRMFAPWFGVLLYTGLIALAIRGFRKRKGYGYAIIFYLATLFMLSNIPFSVGTFMNERFLFLPGIGWLLCMIYFLRQLQKRWGKYYISYSLAGLMGMAFMFLSVQRIPAWENGFELNKAAIKVSKNSARINVFMGVSYFEQYKVEKDRQRKQDLLNKADKYFIQALKIYPKYNDALKMKAGIAAENYKANGDIDALLMEFAKLIEVKPDIAYIHTYLEYLIERDRSPQKVKPFLKRVGYEILYKKHKNYPYALHYLNYGLYGEEDAVLYRMLAEVFSDFAAHYNLRKDKRFDLREIQQKAAYYRQKSTTLAE